MADPPKPAPETEPGQSPPGFRWPALFQRCRQALFLVNRQRRLFYVNRAWEELTGRPAAEVRGLVCKRHRDAEPGSLEALAAALVVPPEVLAGQAAHCRRLLPVIGGGRRWCDLDFFPLVDDQSVHAVLCRILPVAADAPTVAGPLPDKLVVLREAHARRFRLEDLASGPGLESAVLRRVVAQARLASKTRVPVLLRGEPGTGKQWLARAIHYQGPTRELSFVGLDCAHLPPGPLAAMLFGDGGLAWRAQVGTLYLQEPARLSRDLQDRLGALVADSETRGPRVMAGTRGDPAGESPPGQAPDDLLCAVGTLVLDLPPLRDRPAADLPWLVERLLRRAAGDGPGQVPALTPEAWEHVYAYRWPGNVRELFGVLAAARARAGGETGVQRIDAAHLPTFVRLAALPGPAPARPLPLGPLLEQAERRLIELALRMAQGNKSRAAEILSVWRPRLLRRMKTLGIDGSP
jgi:transcriptional regulator of acetoin/glycerol metabolism